jgi:hypothetical protein
VFRSDAGFGLLLPWAVLSVSTPRALLFAPELGCRRQRAPRVLSLLVNGIPRTRYARARADERQSANGRATVAVTDRSVCVSARLTLSVQPGYGFLSRARARGETVAISHGPAREAYPTPARVVMRRGKASLSQKLEAWDDFGKMIETHEHAADFKEW